MKLSEMKRILAGGNLRLTKSLGQNFLHDGNQLRRIVAAAELSRSDRVLEIGPGLGPLTEMLVERAGEVLAIEKDARLVEVLCKRFKVEPASLVSSERDSAGNLLGSPNTSPHPAGTGGSPVLRLCRDDALKYLQREPRDWSDWKLVANLPYSVASPILVELAQNPQRPERMVVTLQLEVARRLMAGPGDKDYGVLTLLIQLDYEARHWFKIPASCFFPAPEVDSACVVLVRRARPLLADRHRETFVQMVKRAFSQRRKMMMKLLKEDWPGQRLEKAFAGAELPPQVRAEALSLEKFVELTKRLGEA